THQRLVSEARDAAIRRLYELVGRPYPDPAEDADLEPRDPGEITRAESRGLLSAVTVRHGRRLGRGALAALDERVRWLLAWAERHYDAARGPYTAFARGLVARAERDFFKTHAADKLARERADEDQRDRAFTGPTGLVAYLRYADAMLCRLQRAGMFTWAPGYGRGSKDACDEFRSGARQRLLEIIDGDGNFHRFEKLGVQATFVV